MSTPINPLGSNNQPEQRPFGTHFINHVPALNGSDQDKTRSLLQAIRLGLDQQNGSSELVKGLKADAQYLMTYFKDGVRETIDFLRKQPGYSLEDLRESREFQSIDNEDFTQTHVTKLEPNPENQNEFEIIEAFIRKSDDQEIKSFRAKILIDPEQDNFASIKELRIRYFDKEMFACIDDPQTNPNQTPDTLLTLDLTPLDTQS